MKLRNILIALVLSLFSLQFAFAAESFKDTDGKSISLPNSNKWTLINYWASWCPSCVYEIPELNRFYKKHPDVQIVGVNYDNREASDLKELKGKLGIAFPVLVQDPADVMKIGHLSAIPATIIMNPQGKIVKKIYGANSEKSLMKVLHQLGKS